VIAAVACRMLSFFFLTLLGISIGEEFKSTSPVTAGNVITELVCMLAAAYFWEAANGAKP
jgi:hypothetical protein